MGFVYIMSNPSLPNLVKIGRTKNIANRRKQLSRTSTPFPFRIEHYVETDHYYELERLVRISLSKHRVNKRREFFDSSVQKAIETLNAIAENLESGIKYLPLTRFSDEELDYLSSEWNSDYEYSLR